MDNEYKGVQWRGFGFAELWPLKAAFKTFKTVQIEQFSTFDH